MTILTRDMRARRIINETADGIAAHTTGVTWPGMVWRVTDEMLKWWRLNLPDRPDAPDLWDAALEAADDEIAQEEP